MQYKTIILQLLEQHQELASALRRRRMLLTTLDSMALALKTRHEAWKERLSQEIPGIGENQLNSESLEYALRELEDRLPPASEATDNQAFNLEEAMTFLLPPTLPA